MRNVPRLKRAILKPSLRGGAAVPLLGRRILCGGCYTRVSLSGFAMPRIAVYPSFCLLEKKDGKSTTIGTQNNCPFAIDLRDFCRERRSRQACRRIKSGNRISSMQRTVAAPRALPPPSAQNVTSSVNNRTSPSSSPPRRRAGIHSGDVDAARGRDESAGDAQRHAFWRG